jgi:glycerol-3-phosphate dehydrogenase
MSHSGTVLIVGGGATGTGVARDLSLRGVDVTLVERDGLAGGTSGRSHGVLHSGARYAESDPRSARECLEENQTLRSIAGECVDETGGLFIQLPEDDDEYFEEKRAACEEAGMDIEVLDGETVRDRVPSLSEDVERAITVPDGVVFPSRLCAANAADAEAHGATIHPNTPLTGLNISDGRVDEATLGGEGDDSIEVTHVINAAGPWAGEVAAMAGLDVGMAPARGVMVAVDHQGIEPVLNRCRDPDDGDIIVPHDTEAVLGTTSVPVDDPEEYERAEWEVERTIDECADMVPSVADAPVQRTWWGARPLYAPDESGEDRRQISRGFVALDHETDGVANFTSVAGGKLTTYRQMAETVSDLVCDKLGVDATCETADRALPGADDADRLNRFVAEYDGRNPTDEPLLTT